MPSTLAPPDFVIRLSDKTSRLVLQKNEVIEVVNRLLDNLAGTVSSKVGRKGVALRQKIGDLRASFLEELRTETFAAKLLVCFQSASDAGVKLSSLANVHRKLFEERPVGDISTSIIQIATVFCLSAESRLILKIEFTSRDDVETMIKDMKIAFDTARDLAADAIDSFSYQTLTVLSGALTNHLATIARPLPRVVTFNMSTTMPALSLSNRIYHTADRWEELVLENKIVHPAFCLRQIRGLSA